MDKIIVRGRVSTRVKLKNIDDKILNIAAKILQSDGNLDTAKENFTAFVVNGAPANVHVSQLVKLIKQKKRIISISGPGISHSRRTKSGQNRCAGVAIVSDEIAEIRKYINYVKRIAKVARRGPITDDPGPSTAR